ncbi:hypothetical protein EDC55_10724 [Allofrancisella inopinata]|uniref:Uncharacterized protein n=1 Tax=Allofrancisella inopinata TaxID=1085647 RepID=A0AAE7CQ96_9GAMM|nr:hypothetical protein E4K63_01015 [Allofrancisella inopinata]TDT72628.1 hypothetical protein EDC55_10724 [Allofrancisella inopinata]
MVLSSVLAIVIALVFTATVARILYKFSFRKGMLQSRKDYIINAIIVGFVFFCVSSLFYIFMINTFSI